MDLDLHRLLRLRLRPRPRLHREQPRVRWRQNSCYVQPEASVVVETMTKPVEELAVSLKAKEVQQSQSLWDLLSK